MTPPPSSSRWLVAGAAASVAVGALAAVLLVRQGGTVAVAPEGQAGGVSEQREPAPPAVVSEVEAPEPEAAPPVSAEALTGLRSMLGKARLFAQLASAGDRLELRSASCGDSQLPTLLAEARDSLWQAGIRRVRCLEPHGQVVFERDL